MDDALVIEHFIEESSGEYTTTTLYSSFSEQMTLVQFTEIITKLCDSGKIAIDNQGSIVWIWHPELRNDYLNSKNLIF